MSDRDRILGHAEDNDGIEEYDNQLPGWWTGMFFFSVVWGIGYAVDYHFVSHRSQVARYDEEMRVAAVRWPTNVDVPVPTDAASIDAGKQLFATTCVACHGADMAGGIGPNLLDTTWIHGGTPEQIRAVIRDGVAAKGMPGWGPVLGPDKVAKLASFVVSSASAGTPLGGPATADTVAAVPPEAMTGELVYKQNCIPCHGEQLQGLVGPSLVDNVWIHGGTLVDITRTITEGVPEKGMVSWGPVLGPEKIALVSSFVHERSTQ